VPCFSVVDGLFEKVEDDTDQTSVKTIDPETFRQVMRDAEAIRGVLAGE
jgi:hypothetical protein